MAELTGISWADSTANLWIGCQKVSAACDNCYAEHLMGDGPNDRLGRVTWGPHGERSYCKQGWADVRKWQRRAAATGGLDPQLGRRRRIFVNSLSDFFDNHPSVVWRDDAWELIRQSPHLIFMLVTKRPQLIGRYLPPFWDEIAERVWLLTTAENQEEANRRIPALVQSCAHRARAAVYGVSCEPLLGPIDLGEWLDPLSGTDPFRGDEVLLDWVIVGGESGKHARPPHPDWVRCLRDQCAAAGVPYHFKQWGEWLPGEAYTEERAGVLHGGLARFPDGPEGDTFPGRPTHWWDGTNAFTPGPISVLAGKSAAGNRLDGRQHLEVPCVA